MKKKNFLSGFSAKIALLVLAVSGAVLTGCYKDDGLDAQEPGTGDILKSAVYTISGTVTDITTGANINGFDLSVDAAGVTAQVDKVDGGYTVKVDKFEAESINVKLTFTKSGFNENEPIIKYVKIYKVADGNAVNYPLSVAMKPNGVKLVDVVYNLSLTVKDAETGLELDRTKFNPEIAPAAGEGGNFVAGTYTIRTFSAKIGETTYLPSSTIVELPAATVKEGESNVKNRAIVLYVTKTTSPVETYVNFSGTVVDKYGKLLQANEVKLYTEGGVEKGTVSSASNFRFTIKNSETDRKYYVAAKIGTEIVKSAVYSIDGGNVDCILMFSNIGDVAPIDPVEAKYNLYVNVLDANTKSPVAGAAIKINGDVFSGKLENQKAGVYTINVTAANYHDAQSVVSLEKVMSDKATTINYVATVYMTPKNEEIVYANIAGLIVDKNGKALNATKVELFKVGETAAVGSVSETSNFRFTVSVKKDVKYWVKATYKDKTAKSTEYDINGGNVDCTLVFEDVDLNPIVPEETENAKYNLYVNVLAAGTNEKISNSTIEIVSPVGQKTNADKLLNIGENYGVYTVNVSADKYYSTTTMVDLVKLEVVKGSPIINKIVTIHLTKMDDPVIVPTKIILAGDVYDKRGILAKSQTIKLLDKDGKVLESVYGVDHYKFEQLSPESTRATIEWTVVAEVINADASGIVKASTKYIYTKGMTEAYSEISFPVNIENGKVVKEDNTSTVTPPQNESGEVSTTVTSVIDKAGSETTSLTVQAGTKITNKDGEAVLTSLVIVRDTNEEKEPAGDTAQGEQTIAPRCYEGYPDGIYFSKPLEFAFTDIYGGQLGTLNLQYFENGKWSSDNAKALDGTSYKNIALNGNNYIMKVPHFSKFRASIVSTTETKKIETVVAVDGKELTIDKTNENDYVLPGIKVEYKGKVGGWAFETPIEDLVKAKFSNANAQKVAVAAINHYLSNKYNVKVENELKEATVLLATIDVPARTYIKSATVKFTKVVMNFTFKLNGVEIPFTVYTYETVDADHSGKLEITKWDMISIGHGHGHGHGHGGNLNAGGGIIVSE